MLPQAVPDSAPEIEQRNPSVSTDSEVPISSGRLSTNSAPTPDADDTSTLNQELKIELEERAQSASTNSKTSVTYRRGVWPVPHITVMYDGQKMAFCRDDLMKGGYKGAQRILFESLLVGTRGFQASDVKTRAQNIRISAWFNFTRGGLDEDFVRLSPDSSKSGWIKLMANVVVLRVEYIES